MPWEKQFNTNDALMKAMDAFWARGYEATSVQDLVECTGVNRGSLYATFGDKHSIFVEALRRYDAIHREAWIARLAKSRSPRKAIVGAFEEAIAAAIDHGSRDGCLLVNTALELSPHDDEVAQIVSHGLKEMEEFFLAMIEEGQRQGEIAQGIHSVDTARSLLGLFIGLRVLSRSRPEAALLTSIAKQAGALVG